MTGSAKRVRCAIYTRKSSDEGLEQGFNSLDAQREACSAYILSQASEGWTALPEIYDDGGISGGTLERPALKRLLADVAAGKIDIIVVYKVDRLSRSLFDFAKLVELFEKAGTSFVSITQAFNTTSSMGRLTLNMLLSFAQFEREVTAERIRDKIAASKAKGMWMGGIPPIGYKPDGRSLAIVEQDAALVRQIFERYVEIGNVRTLAEQLERDRVFTPKRQLRSERKVGGAPFTMNQLRSVLRNRTYIGEIRHQDQIYKGLHPAIIDRELWEAVQAIHAAPRRYATAEPSRSLLAGKLVDETDQPLIPMHSQGRGKRRYSYYVSRSLHRGETATGIRLPGREVESVVIQQLAEALDDPIELVARANLDVAASDYEQLNARALALAGRVRARERDVVRDLIKTVKVLRGSIEIICDADRLAGHLGVDIGEEERPFVIAAPVRLSRSGMAMRLIQGGQQTSCEPDRAMVRLLGQARRLWLEVRKGERNLSEIAEAEKVSPAWLTRVLRIAFLPPALVDAILAGKQPAAVTAKSLLQTDAVSALWSVRGKAAMQQTSGSSIRSVTSFLT